MNSQSRIVTKPYSVACLFLFIAFFSPSIIVMYSSHFIVAAIPWILRSTPSIMLTDLQLLPFALLMNAMRFVFVYQLTMYYNSRTSWTDTIFVGYLSEAVIGMFGLLDFLYLFPFGPARQGGITFPFPILLATAWLFMKCCPRTNLDDLDL